jgi:hypothetical protein
MHQDGDHSEENLEGEDSEASEEQNNQNELDEEKISTQGNECSNQQAKELVLKSNIQETECSGELNIEESESYDKFEDNIHYLNKKYQPYRDLKEEKEEIGDDDSDSDNYSCTTTTSTIMDPGMVRSKVRKSLLAKMKTEKRRLRNKGESALCTEKLREINDTIKSSLNFD